MPGLVPLIVAVTLSAPTAEQQLGRAVCRLALDRDRIALSGELRLTLSIEGPAPVEVDVPQPLTGSPDWRGRSEPPRTTPLPDGRERWEQSFRFEPFKAGDVPLPLQPIRYRTGNEVRDWQLIWPARTIQVTSSVQDVEVESARPIADIDRAPPVTESQATWWYAGAIVLLLIAACGVALWRRQRQRRTPQPILTPTERALAELDQLERSGGPTPEQLPHLADALRRFLEARYQLAATRQTTAEFHVTLRHANVLPEQQVEAAAELLARCDLVKFAAADFDPATCEALLRRARELVTAAGPAGQAAATT